MELTDIASDPSVPSIAEFYQIYQLAVNPWAVAGTTVSFLYDEPTGTAGAVQRRDGTVLVVFRGTQNRRAGRVDRAHNVMIALDPVPFAAGQSQKSAAGSTSTSGPATRSAEDPPAPPAGPAAHRGFLRKFLSVRSELSDLLDGVRGDRLVFAGHSAGGAVATLAFYDHLAAARRRGFRQFAVVELVTFGSPRVLNRHAADEVTALVDADPSLRVHRVVNGRDIVPAVPARFFGYRHVGTELRIGNRPVWKLVSGRDHFPGYRLELEQLLRDAGKPDQVDPDPRHWEFWSRAPADEATEPPRQLP